MLIGLLVRIGVIAFEMISNFKDAPSGLGSWPHFVVQGLAFICFLMMVTAYAGWHKTVRGVYVARKFRWWCPHCAYMYSRRQVWVHLL